MRSQFLTNIFTVQIALWTHFCIKLLEARNVTRRLIIIIIIIIIMMMKSCVWLCIRTLLNTLSFVLVLTVKQFHMKIVDFTECRPTSPSHFQWEHYFIWQLSLVASRRLAYLTLFTSIKQRVCYMWRAYSSRRKTLPSPYVNMVTT